MSVSILLSYTAIIIQEIKVVYSNSMISSFSAVRVATNTSTYSSTTAIAQCLLLTTTIIHWPLLKNKTIVSGLINPHGPQALSIDQARRSHWLVTWGTHPTVQFDPTVSSHSCRRVVLFCLCICCHACIRISMPQRSCLRIIV